MDLNEAQEILQNAGFLTEAKIKTVDTEVIDHEFELLQWHREQLTDVGNGILKTFGNKYKFNAFGIDKDQYTGRWSLYIGVTGFNDYYVVTVYEDGVKIVGKTVLKTTKDNYLTDFAKMLRKDLGK